MDAVQRRGSPARMNYIKRFLSVLVAFVLCLGLIQPPRAKAIVPAVVLAYGSGMAVSAIASVLGSFIAAYVGLRIEQPMIQVGEGYVMGTGGYDFGSMIWPAVVTAGSAAVKKWWEDTIAFFEGKGGFAAGDEITIPADVAEFARNWIVENYDFSAGDVTITQDGIFSGGQFLEFTYPCNIFWTSLSDSPLDLGTCFYLSEHAYTETSISFPGITYSFDWMPNGNTLDVYGWSYSTDSGEKGDLFAALATPSSCYGFIGFNASYLYVGTVLNGKYKFSKTYSTIESLISLPSSVSATDTLNTPVTKDMTVAIPKDVAMGKVGVWDIPATTELTKEGILVGQGEVVEPTAPPQPTAIPGEGTMVGDIAIEGIQTAAQDKSLGALFISKFPFCIPWDFVNAVKLLAAPPKTPYWEVDFLAPISGRYGGALGDTTIYIDFAEYELLGQLSRWITTFLFVTLLMMGTKRLIWTA